MNVKDCILLFKQKKINFMLKVGLKIQKMNQLLMAVKIMELQVIFVF